MNPKFNELGLSIAWLPTASITPSFSAHVEYGEFSNFEAAAKFFGINFDTALYLFSPDTYNLMRKIKISDVIFRIWRVLDAN